MAVQTSSASLSGNVNLFFQNPLRFTSSLRAPGSFVTLAFLDGRPITDQGRDYDSSIEPIFIEKKNWNATKSRYYKKDTAGRRTFKFDWKNIPSSHLFTVDKAYARDYIKQISGDPDVHTLTIVTQTTSNTAPLSSVTYNVFVTGYSENLIRRDLTSNVYLWDCSLDLTEV